MLHIVLDMDGTLIGTDNLQKIIPRPYLEEFLLFCFKNFESVSIWTAANEEWYNEVYENVFKSILLKYDLNFRFVWFNDKCTLRRRQIFYSYNEYYIKRLKKVWNKYKDMNKDNTIIVDDNILSYMDNYGNGMKIKSFINEEDDIELKKIMTRLNFFKDVDSVREYDLNFY